jgi:secreted trypsin-like serine protease
VQRQTRIAPAICAGLSRAQSLANQKEASMRTLTAVIFAANLIGCVEVGGEEYVDDTIDENGETIVGGSVDYGDPAVGMVRMIAQVDLITQKVTSHSTCTATLISPTVMLTAAHCNVANKLYTDVAFVTQPDRTSPYNTKQWVGATFINHPLWNGDITAGHDIAVLILNRPVYTAAIKRGPTPAVNTIVKAVGYGVSVLDGQTTGVGVGTKRHLNLEITGVSGTHSSGGFEGSNVCNGDSGGPVLQNGRVVGVNDYVDAPGCHGGGHFTRIDTNLGFLRTYVPGF